MRLDRVQWNEVLHGEGYPYPPPRDGTVSPEWELTHTSCCSFGSVSPTQLSQLRYLRGLVVSQQRKGPWSSLETAKMSWTVRKGAGCGISSFCWKNTQDRSLAGIHRHSEFSHLMSSFLLVISKTNQLWNIGRHISAANQCTEKLRDLLSRMKISTRLEGNCRDNRANWMG